MHMTQLMPLPLTVSSFSKIQAGFTFLVPAHPGSPKQRVIKWVWLCVCGCMHNSRHSNGNDKPHHHCHLLNRVENIDHNGPEDVL